MDEKYKQFKEYNWVDSKEWQLYYSNLYPTPPPSKILRYKKKFYRNKIDENFDIDYKPPEEEEQENKSNTNTNTNSQNNQNYNYTNQNQENQQTYTNEQTFDTYRQAQSLARPIDSTPLLTIETLVLILFLLSLPIRKKTNLLAIISFAVRTIRLVGIPQFNMTYLQAILMNDACHTLLFSIQIILDKFNYYLIFPVIVSALLALSENTKKMGLNLPYADNLIAKKEEIIQGRANVEVAIGFVSIIGIFLKLNSVFTPLVYWQLIRVRYTLNPYIKESFKQINIYANNIKNSDKCPGLVKTIIDKIQWAVGYMNKMYTPQPGQEQNQGGSMCNIF